MTKCADLGLKRLFCTNSCTLLKSLKSGVPSAKMTKCADRAEKAVLYKLVHFAEIAKRLCAQCKNEKTC